MFKSFSYCQNLNISLIKEHLSVIILYALISALMIYPASPGLLSSVPGNGSDVLGLAWKFWITPQSIFFDENPGYLETNYIVYPETHNLCINALAILNHLIYYPVTVLFNAGTSYSLSVYLSFVLSGYTAFLLAKYLTGESLPAFMGGLIFAFCPFRFLRVILGHHNLLITEWIPLFMLVLLKFIKKPDFKKSLLLAILFTINVYNSIFLAIILSLFACIFMIYYIKDFFPKKNLKYFIIIILISLILLIPYIRSFLEEKDRCLSVSSLEFSSRYSADLTAFITPPFFNPYWGKYIQSVISDFSQGEHFAGYTVLFLLIYGFIKTGYKKERVWLIAGLICFLLALGPVLKVMGKTGKSIFSFHIEDLDVVIPMPYILLYFIPKIGSIIRVPGRFTLLSMLSMAMLCSFSLKELFKKIPQKKILITFLLTIFILMEFSCRVPFTGTEVPEIYRVIGNEKEDYTIMEIPFFIADGWRNIGVYDNRFQYYQSVHKKKLMNGYISILPESLFYYYSNIPLTGTLVRMEKDVTVEEERMVMDREWSEKVVTFFNIKYIIIHSPFTGTEVEEYIVNLLPLKNIQTGDDSLRVYEITKKEKAMDSVNINAGIAGSMLYMIEGWEWITEKENFHYRGKSKRNLVMVPLTEGNPYNIRILMSSPEENSVIIKANKTVLGRIKTGKDPREFTFELPASLTNKRLTEFEFIQESFKKEEVYIRLYKIEINKM